MFRQVPRIRIHNINNAPLRVGGDYVLYWMISARRPSFNFALDRALEWADELGKPLVVLEPLRVGYRWASERLHRFVLDGMAANARAFESTPAFYFPYVERRPEEGKGLLRALARRAWVVVTDDFPCFFLPRMVEAAGRQLDVRLEQVDANGLLPLRAAERVYPTAFTFRRFLQRALPEHLTETPRARPFGRSELPRLRSLSKGITRRWPAASQGLLDTTGGGLESLPLDHSVRAVPTPGGHREARRRLGRFLARRLDRYACEHNEPEREATSGLSPYLHFGHVSVHEIFEALAKQENWTLARLAAQPTGARAGWWRMGESAESFLDQLITWRELGLNMAWQREDFEEYDSLPEWARETLGKHAKDPRPHLYTLDQFERAETHDPLWNAAQGQLLSEGTVHNYLRMLWGKKILEWSESPRKALEIMMELNNKYALDGRDPNSASGIFWTLGRYDRAWGPERPIFGKVRYMSSRNTAHKLSVRRYIETYAPQGCRRAKREP